MPRRHATGEHADIRKSFRSQKFCRPDRAAFFVSHGDDGPCTVRPQLTKLCVDLGQRTQHRTRDMASLSDKLVSVAHINY
jgi:hypothetical protein